MVLFDPDGKRLDAERYIPDFKMCPPERIADMMIVYRRMCMYQLDLNASQLEGPNGIDRERKAIEELRPLLIKYQEIVPKDVQNILNFPVEQIERRIAERDISTKVSEGR